VLFLLVFGGILYAAGRWQTQDLCQKQQAAQDNDQQRNFILERQNLHLAQDGTKGPITAVSLLIPPKAIIRIPATNSPMVQSQSIGGRRSIAFSSSPAPTAVVRIEITSIPLERFI
jgi:hypothetical protein